MRWLTRLVGMVCVAWDLYMACVLGRPATVDLNIQPPTLPVDTPFPKDHSRTPVVPRSENDPPTTLTRSIWSYRATRPLKEVSEMEKEGPCPKDFSRVDRVHNELLELEARMPAYFRMVNPDTRFDDLPECSWLPLARVATPQVLAFGRMALHRPYIFTRPKSRTEALKASLDMLHAQRLHFMLLKPQLYKTFSLFFGTFDAIVLMASIYILFPKEHPEMLPSALQHFQWAVQRFQAMAGRNSLAKAALGVLNAICIRMRKSLGLSKEMVQRLLAPDSLYATNSSSGNTSSGMCASLWDTPRGSTSTAVTSFHPSPTIGSRVSTSKSPLSTPQDRISPTEHSTANGFTHTTYPYIPATALNPGPDFHFNLDPNLFATASRETPTDAPHTNTFDWTLPENFDWSTLQPIYATSDLIYHDLAGSVPLGTSNSVTTSTTNGIGNSSSGFDMFWGYGQSDGNGSGNGNGNGNSTNGDGNEEGVNVESLAQQVYSGGGDGVVLNNMERGFTGTCLFRGDFADDSVWSLFNQYAPL
ncbi:hypothetical protein VTI74DRAFT_2082 [Chaetomium olivicolor]